MQTTRIKKGKPYLFTNTQAWGGKGDNLLKLSEVFDVPQGFVISSDTYSSWVRDQNLAAYLEDAVKQDSEMAYSMIRGKFLSTGFEPYASQLHAEFSRLEKPVAVRSSSVGEDGTKNSYAGQHDSILGVTDFDELLSALKNVYASLFTPRAIEYRRSQGLSNDCIAVVVQKMVNPVASGVAYSPSPNSPNEILVESSWGLCTTVVDGKPCDIYRITDTVTGDIMEDISPKKTEMEIFDHKEKKIVTRKVSSAQAGKPSLSREQVIEIAKTAKSIERSYGMPMDMEFAYEDATGRLYVLQARPITGISMQEEIVKLPDIEAGRIVARSRNIRKPGIFEGPAVVVRGIDHVNREFVVDGDLAELNDRFKDGYVLLSPEIPPQLEQFVTNAKAMIVTECGTTGHAAAIACERGLIYMGRTVSSGPNILQAVRSGDMIGVAASKDEGMVYRVV